MMFQRSEAMGSTPLTILPTARFAAANRAGALRQA